MIITLCGSTKFKSEFEKIAKIFSIKGHIVLTCNCFFHSETEEKYIKRIMKNKHLLDEAHKKKVDICDVVIVINKNNYIGYSTGQEIFYALSKGKKVLFLEKSDFYEII